MSPVFQVQFTNASCQHNEDVHNVEHVRNSFKKLVYCAHECASQTLEMQHSVILV